MTRIDFHSNVADKLHYACRLIRKARSNSKVVVYHHDLTVLRHLDEACGPSVRPIFYRMSWPMTHWHQ
jgi:DNA polymerase IIIc chi subunit